jgi:tRNA-specific 2-thiouridylase
MDVCFVRPEDRRRFVSERTGSVRGVVVDTAGSVLARHDGIEAFTVGQRRGLGVAVGEPRYVVDVDAGTATVTIGSRRDLLCDHVDVRDLTWVDAVPSPGTPLLVQTRAHGTPARGELGEGVVRFDEPARRVARGQVVALYEGDALLGGGIAA